MFLPNSSMIDNLNFFMVTGPMYFLETKNSGLFSCVSSVFFAIEMGVILFLPIFAKMSFELYESVYAIIFDSMWFPMKSSITK